MINNKKAVHANGKTEFGKITQSIFAIFVLVTIFSCNSTKIISTWREPGAVPKPDHLNKFIVAALIKNQETRISNEDLMASYYPGRAVQSYKELGETALKENNEFYNQKLKSEGFDAIVVLHLLKIDKDKRYVAASHPDNFNTSWAMFYANAYSEFDIPGHFTTDKTFEVEVNIYSLKTDKLVWRAITLTKNPSNKHQLYKAVINKINHRIRKEEFLK